MMGGMSETLAGGMAKVEDPVEEEDEKRMLNRHEWFTIHLISSRNFFPLNI